MSRREPCLLVPDPDGPGRAPLIRNGLRGWRAAVGPAVPLNLAASSLRWASQALTLARRGVLLWDGGVVRCAACMPQLLIFSDEELLGLIALRARQSSAKPGERAAVRPAPTVLEPGAHLGGRAARSWAGYDSEGHGRGVRARVGGGWDLDPPADRVGGAAAADDHHAFAGAARGVVDRVGRG
jgi:hypothetical protein